MAKERKKIVRKHMLFNDSLMNCCIELVQTSILKLTSFELDACLVFLLSLDMLPVCISFLSLKIFFSFAISMVQRCCWCPLLAVG